MPHAVVSVVIPTRNRVRMLTQALRAVMAQRHIEDVALDLLVVDEGSTDGTSAWLEGLDDPRIRVIRHQLPHGLAAARNVGIAAARGDVIGFCDDDDLWVPDKLSRQLAAMREADTAWAFGGALSFTAGPTLIRVTHPPPPDAAREGVAYVNVVPGGGSNAIVTRQALDAVGGFDAALHPMEDWRMWMELARHGPPAVVHDVVVAYRHHGGNMSRGTQAMLDSARVLDLRSRSLRDGRPLDWDDLYRWMGRAALQAGDRRAAIGIYARAVRAGHPHAARRLLRSLLPIGVRPPVSRPEDANGMLDRVRPRAVQPWPEGTEAWLRSALADE